MNKQFQSLNASLAGHIVTDDDNIHLYSSDASLYQIKPKAVAFPKHSEDCQKIVSFAAAENIAITPRTAGTSLAGQAVGDGIVVDVSRFMNEIIDINSEQHTAVVQPGAVPSIINAACAPFGLFFPPNPSTDNRCCLGGMVANNAWGPNAPQYGDTSDYINALEMVLADSNIVKFSDISLARLEQIYADDDFQATLYQEVIKTVKQQRHVIQTFPWYRQGVPNNMGYRLHKLLNRITDPQHLGAEFNMSQLICGSEGSLGLITEVTVSLEKKLAHKNMLCAHFARLEDALNAVPVILSQRTVTIELLDKTLIDLVLDQAEFSNDTFWINHDAHAILLIEVEGNDAAQLQQINASIQASLIEQFDQLHFHSLQDQQTTHAWRVRKSMLGLLFSLTGSLKPVSFVEDCAVPVQQLASFTQHVKNVLSMLNIRGIFYGSVSRGLIHIRPLLDLSLPLHREYLKEIQRQIFSLVEQCGGSISAKHGDGRIRAPSIRQLLGEDYTNACLSIKKLFDPNNIFNPGTIFSDDIMLEKRRAIPLLSSPNSNLFTGKNKNESFIDKAKILQASTHCQGAGVCLQTSAEINICPTYKAARDEAFSTRGRANIIRQSISTFNKSDEPHIDHQAINRAVNHCLACQACKTDCPAHIDMASIKIQWLNKSEKSHVRSAENLLFQHFPAICSALSRFPRISNSFANLSLSKSILNCSSKRIFPSFNQKRFSQHLSEQTIRQINPNNANVVIINDAFSEFFDTDVGPAALSVMSKMGYNVKLTPIVTSFRLLISRGLFDQARQQLKELTTWLEKNTSLNDIMLGLEPSEVLCILNECMDISRGTSWYTALAKIKSRIILFDEFVLRDQNTFIKNLSRSRYKERNVFLHTHCHQKSNHAEQCSIDVLKLLPNCHVNLIKTGCCGMAGYFGYQKENYDLSVKVAQLDLLPAINKMGDDDLIVATGTSCRTQISDLTTKTALHTSQILANYMNNLIE